MEFMYNLDGSNNVVAEDFIVNKTTKIKKGQVLKYSANKVALSATGPYIGIAAENHDGEANMLNPRAGGDFVKVTISPHAVYSTDAPNINFIDGGTSETAVYTGISAYDDIDFSSGYIVCVSKAPTSVNTDSIGAVRRIISYVKATMKMTVTTGGTICAGDVYAYFPPLSFNKMSLSADYSNTVLSSVAGDFVVVGRDIANRKIYVTINAHAYR